MTANNVSEDWDEAAYWDRFEQDNKVRQTTLCSVCDDPNICVCELGDFGPARSPWEILEGSATPLGKRLLSALQRALLAP